MGTKDKEKNRQYVAKWRATHSQQRTEHQQRHNKTYYQTPLEQEKQRQFTRYHTKVKKKKPLSEAQLQCIQMAHEYDKLRDVSSYSHKD